MNTVIDTIIDGGGATRFDVFWAESSERVTIKLWDLETLENFVRQSFEGDDEKDEIFEERERTLIARVRALEAALAWYADETNYDAYANTDISIADQDAGARARAALAVKEA